MYRLSITAILTLISILSSGQSDDSFLDRFNRCDSTLSGFDVINQIYLRRDIDKIHLNDGKLELFQKLEEDSSFAEMEIKSAQMLNENPLNIAASFYYTLSQLRLGNKENLGCLWDKTMKIYSTVRQFGDGTREKPYIISDFNDAKAFIHLFWAEGVKIDSTSIDGKGILNISVTNAEGEKEAIFFDFSNNLNVREIYFDYHRDFEFYKTESKNPKSRYYYDTLLKRFQSHDKTLTNHEIIALMIGFTDNLNYQPYKSVSLEREIMNLISDGSYKESLKKSQDHLRTNPLNFTAVMEEGFALMKIKKDESYFPSVNSRMLVDAILWSGDGSVNNPYFVLSPIDGQTIIKYIFGGNLGIMGSGNDANGYFLDILEMKKEGEESITYYFIIEHATKTFMKELEDVIETQEKD